MALFKVCEKDTKTKTYSKEGLARAAKLDPEEQKKVDCNSWVLEMVDVMMQKVDEVRMARQYSEGGGALLILAAKSKPADRRPIAARGRDRPTECRKGEEEQSQGH